MSEHRSLWIAVGAGLFFLGWGGNLSLLIGDSVARLPLNHPIQHVCLVTAGLGVVVLASVIARLIVIGQHKRHLNNLTAEGNDVLRAIKASPVADKNRRHELETNLTEWSGRVTAWLRQKFPMYEAHFTNEGNQKYLYEVVDMYDGQDTLNDRDFVVAHWLEVQAAAFMNRLGEITMKL